MKKLLYIIIFLFPCLAISQTPTSPVRQLTWQSWLDSGNTYWGWNGTAWYQGVPSPFGNSGKVLGTDGTYYFWEAPGTGAVTSVFGRTGAVTAQSNDGYSSFYLTLASPNQSVIQTPLFTNGIVSAHQSNFYMSGADAYAISTSDPVTHVFDPVVFGQINMQNGFQMYSPGQGEMRFGSSFLFDDAYSNGKNITVSMPDEGAIGNPAYLHIAGSGNAFNLYPSNGTISRISDGATVVWSNGLGGYVPYTGATTTVNLGSNQFSAGGITVTNTNGTGNINLATQSSTPATPSSGIILYANSSNQLGWLKSDGHLRTMRFPYNGNELVSFPNLPAPTLPDSAAQANTGGALDYWFMGSNFYKARFNIAVNSLAATYIGGTNVPTYLVFIGDSRLGLSSGLLRGAIGQYQLINGLGFNGFYNNNYPGDLTYTQTGTYTNTRDDNSSTQAWGINGSRCDLGLGGVATFMPSSKFKFDAFRIWYNIVSGGGSFTYTIDGGSPVTVNTSTGTSNTLGVVSVNSGSILTGGTTHTIVVTGTTTATCRMYGIDFYNKAQSGFVCEILNSGGSEAAQWNGNTGYTSTFINTINPAMATIWLGINDAVAGSPASTYITNIAGIVTGLSLPVNCPVNLITEMPTGLSPTGPLDSVTYNLSKQYRYKLLSYAPTIGASIFDLQTYWGPYAYMQTQGYYADAIHPTPAAAFGIWSGLVRCIMPVFQEDYLSTYDSYKNANILLPQDGSYGLSVASVASNGIISASGTGFYANGTGSMYYKLLGVNQLQFSTNLSGNSMITGYATSTTPNILTGYRQGSTVTKAFDIQVTSTGQTSLITNNGALLANVTGILIGAGSAINTNTSLDMSGITTKGVLFPQLTTTTLSGLVSPTVSLMAWNTTTGSFQYRIATGGGQFVNILSDFHPTFQANTTNTGFFNSPTGVTESSPVSGDWSRPSASVINFYDGTTIHTVGWLDSPALTGSPTAPTQTSGDNSTKIATTAYDATAIANATNGIVILASNNTTLVAGTKAISVTGVTTSSHAFIQAVSQGGTVSTTFEYAVVCTSGIITITALTTGNVTNTLDTSTVNYFVTK